MVENLGSNLLWVFCKSVIVGNLGSHLLWIFLVTTGWPCKCALFHTIYLFGCQICSQWNMASKDGRFFPVSQKEDLSIFVCHQVWLADSSNCVFALFICFLKSPIAARWCLMFCRYADKPHCYWTGYFTSRSSLKGYVRKLSGFLQVSSSKFDDVLCLHLVPYI